MNDAREIRATHETTEKLDVSVYCHGESKTNNAAMTQKTTPTAVESSGGNNVPRVMKRRFQ